MKWCAIEIEKCLEITNLTYRWKNKTGTELPVPLFPCAKRVISVSGIPRELPKGKYYFAGCSAMGRWYADWGGTGINRNWSKIGPWPETTDNKWEASIVLFIAFLVLVWGWMLNKEQGMLNKVMSISMNKYLVCFISFLFALSSYSQVGRRTIYCYTA